MNTGTSDSRKINIDFENLVVLYKHYKEFMLPIGVIIVSILVIFYIVFPQIQQYFTSQDSVKAEQQKLTTLKNNYSLLASLSDATIASNLQTLSLALPPQKDFAGIIGAITYLSAKTSVSVGDFEFSLGNLSASNFGGTAYPSTKIDISLRGNTKDIIKFTHEISKSMPIAEVTELDVSGSSGTVTVLFYYKAFPAQNISAQAQIVPLSANQLSLVNDISTWNSIGGLSSPVFSPTQIASSSAAVSGSPF
jgi:Tfp pilus assembly protein PilO